LAGYKAIKDWIYGLQVFGIKLGLNSTESLLKRLGDPHKDFASIHLAGTNGKGSTASVMAAALIEAGYKVGLYTSPHLVSFRERFLINGRMPRPERLAGSMARVRAVVDESEPPTFFEFVTALAFLYFKEQGVEVAVIETGMGGRLDATNVLQPLVSLISDIGVEHTQYLGRTLKEIAGEKAGIIKPGVPVVTQARRPTAVGVIAQRAEELKAPLYRLGRDFKARWGKGGLSYRGLDWSLKGLRPGLPGRHQGRNAALALAGLEVLNRRGLPVDEQAACDGLEKVNWPGRFQAIGQRPLTILDGAHNPAACRVLAEALKEVPRRRLILVLGAMADKDLSGMLKALGGLLDLSAGGDELILTRAAYERSATPEALAEAAQRLGYRFTIVGELLAAIGRAREMAGQEDLIVITGSLFIAGETLAGLGLTPIFKED